jgi:uncharacterized protein with von Willebrand factor type A (vWA) domain
MIALRDAILDFIADLRAAGVRISVAESLDAMNAVAAAGLARSRMCEALAAALIKEEADRATFDEIFGRRFAGRSTAIGGAHQSRGEFAGVAGWSGGPSDSATPSAAPQRRDDDDAPAGATPSRKPAPSEREAPRPAAEPSPARQPGDGESDESRRPGDADGVDTSANRTEASAIEFGEGREAGGAEADSPGIEAGRAARLRMIERLPFANYSEVEFEAARDALAALKRRFRIRVSRRLRIARAGRIDFRRTIRASLQHGGALGDLRFRARRPRHLDLLILADMSGSVKYASTLMLEIAAGAYSCFRRVRSFVYIDRLAEAGFERGHLTTTPPLDLYARSDFGRVLADLWERRAALVTRATVIVIMGDGRNNRRPARADLLRDLARLSRAVLWLIPEPQARWNIGDSAIRQYAREATALIPCENLWQLERGLARAI